MKRKNIIRLIFIIVFLYYIPLDVTYAQLTGNKIGVDPGHGGGSLEQ